jgi:hypothetical protein
MDQLAGLLPPGPALEFVKRLPRRMSRKELIPYLEALVVLMQAEECRR